MQLLHRARPAAAPEPADQVERSHTLVPMVDAMAAEWPSHEHAIVGCYRRRPA